MIELPRIEESWIERGRERAARASHKRNLKPHEWGHPERIFLGTIGECAAESWLPGARSFDTFDNDLLWKDRRVEVKTISCNSLPMPHYETTINQSRPGENRQSCDLYVFLRLWRKQRRIWIVGWDLPEEWWAKATRKKRGEPLYPGGPRVELTFEECWTVPINRTRRPAALLEHFDRPAQEVLDFG